LSRGAVVVKVAGHRDGGTTGMLVPVRGERRDGCGGVVEDGHGVADSCLLQIVQNCLFLGNVIVGGGCVRLSADSRT
jgi:hypothetical protein